MAEDKILKARENNTGLSRFLQATGLSGKLLVLTVMFVMLAEVLIFVPSVANFRMNWLRERLASAQIASLALEAAPDRMVSEMLRKELLENAGVLAVSLRRPDSRGLVLSAENLPTVSRSYDLRTRSAWANVLDAFDAIMAPEGRTIRVISAARFGGGNSIEIVFNETPLKAAIWTFCVNIAFLSIIISIITAALVYLALNWLLVRPMRSLTGNMVHFGQNPEDKSRIIKPSGRRDEIGTAEIELSQLQSELGQMLQQKSRLAALGLAVSKISHDLRNILAHAQLVSDRLGQVEDPTVKRVAPKLIGSLDRAIDLCVNTLKYGKAKERAPERARFVLLPLVEEVLETLDPQSHRGVVFHNAVAGNLEIDADREQLFRIILNITRNAVQALESCERREGAGQIVISAKRRGAVFYLSIEDDGPGIPRQAREHLFEAFQNSTRKGGSGLGLAISAELVQAHGGTLELDDTEHGARFKISIPDRIAKLSSARERRKSGAAQKRAT